MELIKNYKNNTIFFRFQTIPNSQLQQQPKFIRIVSSGNALSTNSTPIKVLIIVLVLVLSHPVLVSAPLPFIHLLSVVQISILLRYFTRFPSSS